MKPAYVEDVWRRLRAGKTKVTSIHVSWAGVPRITDNSLKIEEQFSVICGENGVGKSTILHTILNALVAPLRRSESAVFVRQEEGGFDYVRVELSHGPWGAPRTLISIEAVREHFDSAVDGLRVALFDPAMHVPIILKAIHGDANFSEVVEPLGPVLYDRGQVSDLSYIVGRDYDSVRAYEIDGYGGLGVFPYFKVEVSGVEYGSEAMGFGELSLLLAYWLFSRMPKGSLILLEEPETFVSPRSQGRLINIAARFALESEFTVIATTHSPSVVSRFNNKEVTLVSRAAHNVTLTAPVPVSILERRLELVNPIRRVWLVEDAVAARVLRFFLQQAELDSVSDVLIVGNNDSVVAFAGSKTFGDSRLVLNGILDGDQRGLLSDQTPSLYCLPGDDAPELMIKRFCARGSRAEVAQAVGVDANGLEIALAAAGGDEPHAWLHSMRRDLGVSLDQFIVGVLYAWLRNSPVEGQAFISRLKEMAEYRLPIVA